MVTTIKHLNAENEIFADRRIDLLEILSIFDELSIGVTVVNGKGIVIYINRMAGSFLKIQPEDAVGRHINSMSPKSQIFDTFKSNKPKQGLLYNIGDQQYKVSLIPWKDGGKIIAALEFMENQTKMISLASELSEFKKKYELLDEIINATFEEMGAIDKHGRITYISKKTALNQGLDPKSIIGKKIYDLNLERSCLLSKVVKTGKPMFSEIAGINKQPVPMIFMPIYLDNELEGAVCKSLFRNLDETREFIERMIHFTQNNINYSKRGPSVNLNFKGIIGNSFKLLETKKEAVRAARSDSTILLIGETGTGKECFANAIHNESKRSKGPFVRVNCAGIPESLLEAELFGFEEGSFTGARKGGKPGKFELADNGTLFLDEAGDMGMPMQAKLLRVLEDHEFERIGSTQRLRVNIRIISATNQDLIKLVKSGLFREDLYYRLDVVNIKIPPLRERPEDIPALIKYFMTEIRRNSGINVKNISSQVHDLLLSYSWPGNVRELRNMLEGAMIRCDGNTLTLNEIPNRIREEILRIKPIKYGSSKSDWQIQRLGDAEREMIVKALRINKGNKRKTAICLGIPRSSLYIKINRYSIEV